MIDKLKGLFIGFAAIAALALGGAAIAGAAGDDQPADDPALAQATNDDNEAPGNDDDAGEADEQVTDPQTVGQARASALKAAGGGTVTEIEHADEGDSGYEVEVKRADGSFVEIALDPQFDVVSVENDDD